MCVCVFTKGQPNDLEFSGKLDTSIKALKFVKGYTCKPTTYIVRLYSFRKIKV